jgi:hypothetical protein
MMSTEDRTLDAQAAPSATSLARLATAAADRGDGPRGLKEEEDIVVLVVGGGRGSGARGLRAPCFAWVGPDRRAGRARVWETAGAVLLF